MVDWQSIHYGLLARADILECVKDPDWQRVRVYMKGKSLEERYNTLVSWLEVNEHSHCSKVQVTNYLNALARAGMIRPLGGD